MILFSLQESSVTRNENLTDMKAIIRFSFDSLVVNGSYAIKGTLMWYQVDSKGIKQ